MTVVSNVTESRRQEGFILLIQGLVLHDSFKRPEIDTKASSNFLDLYDI